MGKEPIKEKTEESLLERLRKWEEERIKKIKSDDMDEFIKGIHGEIDEFMGGFDDSFRRKKKSEEKISGQNGVDEAHLKKVLTALEKDSRFLALGEYDVYNTRMEDGELCATIISKNSIMKIKTDSDWVECDVAYVDYSDLRHTSGYVRYQVENRSKNTVRPGIPVTLKTPTTAEVAELAEECVKYGNPDYKITKAIRPSEPSPAVSEGKTDKAWLGRMLKSSNLYGHLNGMIEDMAHNKVKVLKDDTIQDSSGDETHTVVLASDRGVVEFRDHGIDNGEYAMVRFAVLDDNGKIVRLNFSAEYSEKGDMMYGFMDGGKFQYAQLIGMTNPDSALRKAYEKEQQEKGVSENTDKADLMKGMQTNSVAVNNIINDMKNGAKPQVSDDKTKGIDPRILTMLSDGRDMT